jgi:sensor histidine kinase YesM
LRMKAGKKFKLLLIFGIWLLTGLFFGTLHAMLSALKGYQCSMLGSLFHQVPNFLMWGFYTIFIFRLHEKYPIFNKGPWKNMLLIHIPFSTIIAVFHICFMSLVNWVTGEVQGSEHSFFGAFMQYSYGWLFFEYLIYAVVLLAHYGLTLYSRYKEKESQLLKVEKSLINTRLNALKMQLQPHFLFNTFNTLSMLIRQKDEKTATGMLAKLGDLLRYVLDNREVHWVTLEQEIGFIKNYLAIESIRFQNRLNYSIDIASGTADLLLPDLLLQPVVENALKHGISNKIEGGEIRIKAFQIHEKLFIEIRDNGKGFDEEEYLNNAHSMGLRNVMDRIETMYGGKATINIDSTPGKGTKILFSLPVRSEVYLNESCQCPK